MREQYTSIVDDIGNSSDEGVQVLLCASTWLRSGVQINDDFKDRLTAFDCGWGQLHEARDVNGWVELKTKGAVKNLITDEDAKTAVCILVAVVYFKVCYFFFVCLFLCHCN